MFGELIKVIFKIEENCGLMKLKQKKSSTTTGFYYLPWLIIFASNLPWLIIFSSNIDPKPV